MSDDSQKPDQRPESPPEEPEEGQPLPLMPLSTRLALYYILIFLVILFGGSLVLAFFGNEELWKKISEGEGLDIGLILTIEACLLLPIVATTLGFIRFVDRKLPFEIGATWPPGEVERAPRDLAGAMLTALVVLGFWRGLAGMVATFEPVMAGDDPQNANLSRVALFAIGFLAASCLEAWILHGYIYSALREQLSWVHAGGVSALLFVLPQAASPEVPAAGLVNAFLIAMLLAAMRELTGSFWPGVLFHGTWNTLTGSFFGLPVSGLEVPRIQTFKITGSEVWTGGEFGPEGSWLLSALVILALIRLAARLTEDVEVDEVDEF